MVAETSPAALSIQRLEVRFEDLNAVSGGQFEGHLPARFGSWDLFWRISQELWHATFLILKSYKGGEIKCSRPAL